MMLARCPIRACRAPLGCPTLATSLVVPLRQSYVGAGVRARSQLRVARRPDSHEQKVEADATSTAEGAAPPGSDQEAAESSKQDDFFGAEELAQELVDPQHFGKRGEAWVLAQLALVALIAFPPLPLQGLVAFCGTLALSAGVVFMLYALMSLGRNLSPMPHPRKKHALVTTGMYSYVRHPMYAGLVMASLGFAAVTMSEIRLALALLLWWVLEQKVEYEENLLRARYPEYDEYVSKVKKFFPFLY